MIVVVLAFLIFGYIIVQRALLYWTFPKTVTIEVVYKKAMPYPVVTICNQNFFRWVALREKVPDVLSCCHTKRRTGARGRARPSFGMTPNT